MRIWVEKIKKNSSLSLPVLLLGMALGIVQGIVFLSIFNPVFQSDKWAAWVQSVGSILAICVAIYIPFKQRRDEKKIEKEKDIEHRLAQMFALYVLVSETLKIARYFVKNTKRAKDKKDLISKIQAERLRGIIDQSRKIPLELLPEQFMMFTFELRSLQFQMLELMEQFFGQVDDAQHEVEFNLFKDKAEKLNTKIRQYYREYKQNWPHSNINSKLWRFSYDSKNPLR